MFINIQHQHFHTVYVRNPKIPQILAHSWYTHELLSISMKEERRLRVLAVQILRTAAPNNPTALHMTMYLFVTHRN
jgi:hypothetical protein